MVNGKKRRRNKGLDKSNIYNIGGIRNLYKEQLLKDNRYLYNCCCSSTGIIFSWKESGARTKALEWLEIVIKADIQTIASLLGLKKLFGSL